MANAGDAAEGFDIEVYRVARTRPFVARDGRRWGQPREPIQSGSGQDGGDGRARDLELHCDRPGTAALKACRHDAGRDRRRRASRLMMRRRRAVLERGRAAETMTGEPLIRAAHANPRGARGCQWRPALLPNPINEQGAHMRRRLGVTMKLHSGSPLGLNGTCGNAHSFQGIPSEQPH